MLPCTFESHDQPGILESKPVPTCWHGPLVCIGGVAITDIVGFELLQKEAVFLDQPQPCSEIYTERGVIEDRGDLEVCLQNHMRKLGRPKACGKAVFLGVGGAISRPVTGAVHI